MSPGELDSLLERAGELPGVDKLPTDPIEMRRWAEQACGLLLELRSALGERVKLHGGTFAMRVREALEEQILQQLNGRATLTKVVDELSVGVHLLHEGVIVDVRLRVGKVSDARE